MKLYCALLISILSSTCLVRGTETPVHNITTNGDLVYVWGSASWNQRWEKVYFKAFDASSGKLKWHFPTDASCEVFPAFCENMVLIWRNDDSHLYALDLVTGEEKWRFEILRGLSSKPIIIGQNVYLTDYEQALYCLDLKTARCKWKFQPQRCDYSHSRNARYDDYRGDFTEVCGKFLYRAIPALENDSNIFSARRRLYYKLDLSTGRVLKECKDPVPAEKEPAADLTHDAGDEIWTVSSEEDGLLFAVSRREVQALGSKGGVKPYQLLPDWFPRVAWSWSPPGSREIAVQTFSGAPPLLFIINKKLIVEIVDPVKQPEEVWMNRESSEAAPAKKAPPRRTLCAIDTATKKTAWSTAFDPDCEFYPSDESLYYTSGDHNVGSIDLADGAKHRVGKFTGLDLTGLDLKDKKILGIAVAGGTIFLHLTEYSESINTLVAVDKKSGKKKWGAALVPQDENE